MYKIVRTAVTKAHHKATVVILASLALVTTTIGLRAADASVAAVNGWPATPQIVSNSASGTVTGTVTVGAGSNRVMLVAVAAEYSATPATQPITVTYGGKTVTQLQNNLGGPNTIWLGFLNEAGIASASGTTLTVTNGNTANLVAMYAAAAIYSGVDQASPISGSNSVTSGTTAVTTMNMPAFTVKGAAGNTALSFYISNRNLQSQSVDPAYTQNNQYLGTNFYMAFNTIATPPTGLITTAPAVTTSTASTGAAVGVGLVPAGVPGIGSVSSCGRCHGYPPANGTDRNIPIGQFQGSHDKHAGTAAGQYGLACTRCHVNNAELAHANGTIDMASPINGNTGASYGKGTSFAVSNAAFSGNTCSNTFCHSNGTGGTSNPGDTRAIVANASPTWGSTTTCTSCHSQPPAYANYTGTVIRNGQKANSHGGTTHASKTCDTCHSSVTTSNGGASYTAYTTHANGRYNIKASIGYTYGVRGGTCTSPGAGCHGQATWGRTMGCISCHGNSQPSPIAAALDATVTSRVAITPDFSLASRHIRSRTASPNVTDFDCCVCHMEGDVTTGKPTSFHKDGRINLRDPDTGLNIKGVTHSGSTTVAGAYASTTTDAAPVRFSRNLGNATIEADTAAIMINLCLKCHDANGASNASARLVGASAGQPFGAAIAANPSSNVLDVASQFAATNRSFHPVLVRQNNGYTNTGGSRMVAPWNGVTKTGTTTTYGPLISCWDCHAPNGTASTVTLTSSGIHGGTVNGTDAVPLRGNVYVNGSTAATNLCLYCHVVSGGTTNHGTGSAITSSTNSGMTYFQNRCYFCHASDVSRTRPWGAGDAHGFNARGGVAGNNQAFPAVSNGYAFIRSEGFYGNSYQHSIRSIGASTYTATCTGRGTAGGGAGACSRSSMGGYTPGGVY